MSEVYFYRITESDPFELLRRLLERSHDSGWRVAVRARTQEEIESLDRRLWHGDGFLPHARAGGPFDAEQPILLTTGDGSGNHPDALILFDGAAFDDAEIDRHRRISIVFRAGREDEMKIGRRQWSRLAKAGVCLQYWAHVDGRWKKEASQNYPRQ